MRYNLPYIEKQWGDTSAHHLIATGQVLRTTLIENCGEDWLREHKAYMIARDTTLQTSYIEVSLTFINENFYLQNIGYSNRPHWLLSFHDAAGIWTRIKFPHQDLRSQIESYVIDNIRLKEMIQKDMRDEVREIWRRCK